MQVQLAKLQHDLFAVRIGKPRSRLPRFLGLAEPFPRVARCDRIPSVSDIVTTSPPRGTEEESIDDVLPAIRPGVVKRASPRQVPIGTLKTRWACAAGGGLWD